NSGNTSPPSSPPRSVSPRRATCPRCGGSASATPKATSTLWPPSPAKTAAPSGHGRTTAARKPAAVSWNSTTGSTASAAATPPRPAPPPTPTPTPADLTNPPPHQRDEVPRRRLRRLAHAAAGTASDEQDFLDRLRTSGLLVRPRANTTNPNQPAGYAIALPDD